MKNLSTILGAAILTFSALSASATEFGYTDGTCNRNNMFRVGTATAQGLAIRIPHEKLALLKGSKITSISATFGSSHTTDGNATVFVGTTLSTPITESTVAIARALQWGEYALTTPYVITGDEPELYIGYRGDIASSSSLLMHDGNRVIPATCYALNGSEWVDLADLDFGSANIRFNLEGAPTAPDAIIKPINTKGYYKAETDYSFEGQLFNFGSQAITSFDLKVTVGDKAPVTKSFTGLNIAPATNFDFILDPYAADAVGMLPISLEVANVNGASDFDATDNVFAGDIFMYPANMERSVIIEGFTGQSCGNCPSGHTETHRWLETVPEGSVIEVMHHAGYQPDFFTMDADLDYTFFYGQPTTYAPAMMMNRTVFPVISSVPVFGPSGNTLNTVYNIVQNTQPYVSLVLEAEYDPASRETNVYFKSEAHNDLPAANNVFNIMIVQDGLTGEQSGAGSGYVHNSVFRGTLIDNSWGKLLPARACKAGGEYEWTYSFTFPEEIFSDYYASFNIPDSRKGDYTHAVVPENMRLVAYVGALGGEELDGHSIYNAVEVKLGERHEQGGVSGVQQVNAAPADVALYLNGRTLVIKGEYDALNVYDMNGAAVSSHSELAPGLYVVRVISGKQALVKKILVK